PRKIVLRDGSGRPSILPIPQSNLERSVDNPSLEPVSAFEQSKDEQSEELGDLIEVKVQDILEEGKEVGRSMDDFCCEKSGGFGVGGQTGFEKPFLRAVTIGAAQEEGDSGGLEGNRDIRKGIRLSHQERRDDDIIFTINDVAEERAYWDFALIDYFWGIEFCILP
ncbi:hypothetical protein Dimus_024330, partial [Dionaea muscipula]